MRYFKQISATMYRAVVCTLLCGLLVICMSACTTKKTDETIISESVADVLGEFKSIDSDIAKRFISEMDIKELGSVGLNSTDFMKVYSDGFDYEISDIRIDGKSAEADIAIYVKSFSEFEKRFAAEVTMLAKKYAVDDKEDEKNASSSSISPLSGDARSTTEPSKISVTSEEMNAMFARTVINCMKEAPVRKTKIVTVQFANSENTWRPSPTAMDDILTAMIEN